MVASTGQHRQAAGTAEKAAVSPFLKRPAVRALKATLWAGIGVSGLGAEYVRSTWLMRAPFAPGVIVAVLLGVGLAGICVAGLEAVRVAARREWREAGPVILEGGAEVIPEPAAHADCDARLEAQDRRIGEIFSLMECVCAELNVDTGPAAHTLPQLRLVPSGEAG